MSVEFEEYKKGLTGMFEFLLSADTFAEDIAGDMNGHINTLKNIYVSQLLREWCAANNYYPEAISMITASKEDANKNVEIISQQLTSTMRNGVLILRTMDSVKKAISDDLKNVNGDGGDAPTTDTGSTSTDDVSEPGSDGGDDMGDVDDMLKL
jgi:hypothetical protein